MAFIVNSAPGAGFRFEPSATFGDAASALDWAVALERRGMRLIRIRDKDGGRIFEVKELREELKRLQAAS